jgi:hypothetical protein
MPSQKVQTIALLCFALLCKKTAETILEALLCKKTAETILEVKVYTQKQSHT